MLKTFFLHNLKQKKAKKQNKYLTEKYHFTPTYTMENMQNNYSKLLISST